MDYIGSLYGKVAGRFLPLEITTKEVDKIQSENIALRSSLAEMTELAEEYALLYADNWGNYRKDIQLWNKARVDKSRALLEGIK